MSVLFMDSPTSREGAAKWTGYAVATIEAGGAPHGGDAYGWGNNSALRRDIVPTSSVLAGWKMKLNDLSQDNSSNSQIFGALGDNGVTLHLTLTFSSDGRAKLRRGAGDGIVVGETAANLIKLNGWHSYEVRATINDATGRAQLWVDDALVIDFTGDTRNGGTSTDIDRIRWYRSLSTSTTTVRASDFVISDSAVPLGSCRVHPLKPIGAGTTTQLTPSAGANWENVDEQTPDGDTTYNSSATEGNIDTYALADLPANPWDVLAIQTSLNARKADSGAKFLRPVLRTGAANHVGTSKPLAESYTAALQMWDQNPGTLAAWTSTEIDALEAGAEVRDS